MKINQIKRISIFGHLHRDDMSVQLNELIHYFKNKGVEILIDKYLLDHISQKVKIDYDKITLIENDNLESDLALSVGGDGTFLNTALRINHKNIPILGINSGRLGFLADVAREEIISALENVFEGNYYIENRSMLEVKALDGAEIDSPFALNDVSVLKQDSSSMIIIDAYANNELINSYQADGLIFATPTGSTAYSMSVGGPIVVPQSNNLIISPVASHSLNVRPLIVPDDWEIELKVTSRSESYLVSIDGRSKILDHNTKLRITKANFHTKVLKISNHTFFDTLRKKLLWGADVRNK